MTATNDINSKGVMDSIEGQQYLHVSEEPLKFNLLPENGWMKTEESNTFKVE